MAGDCNQSRGVAFVREEEDGHLRVTDNMERAVFGLHL